MKFKIKSALAGVATLAVAGAGFLSLATAASASPTTPPWEPDPQAAAPFGNLVFYDASGNVVTGGTDLTHLFDYAAATTGPTSGSTKATLFFAAPNSAKPTSGWTVAQASTSDTFPNTTYPAPLTGPGFANPTIQALVANDDADLNALVGGFVLDSSSGYANMIQVRMKDTNSSSHYWESDIAYNQGSTPITTNGVTVQPGDWAQVSPVVATTTTTLAASPASPQSNPSGATHGQNVTLTATISPASGGTVQFFDGGTALGSPVAVTGGTATGTAPAPSFGTHSYTAQFTPTGGTEVQGSTSSALSYVVNPPQTATSTSLSGPSTAAQYDAVSYTATETPVPTTDGGTFTFVATGTGTTTGTSTIGTAAESAGTGTLNVSSLTLSPGTYDVTAKYHPTDNTFADSTSQPVALTVTSAHCPGAPVSGASCSDTQNITVTVNPGSLTITTPYDSTNPYVLPAMQLSGDAKLLQTSGQFPAAGDPAITVHSSLAGDPGWTVSVTDSDLTCASGNCFTSPVAADYQTINGENLGLVSGTSDAPSAAFPGTVAFTNGTAGIPPANGVAPSDAMGGGLKGGPHSFATAAAGNGTVDLHGTLELNAPTATQDGVYTGTITFTVG